jgi:hypothetical protein
MRAAAVALVSLLLGLAAADAAPAAKPKHLKAFTSCNALVKYARAGALKTQGGVGVQGRAIAPAPDVIGTPPVMPMPMPLEGVADSGTSVGGLAPPPQPAATPLSGRGETFSGTNVQEVDVDEPDIVKTDGQRIFVVTDGTLRVFKVGEGVTGTLKLDGLNHRLMLRGNRVLVIAAKGAVGIPTDLPVAPRAEGVSSATIVTEIDVTNAPKVLRTMEVPGRFVDARQNGAVARLVIDAPPKPLIPGEGETIDDVVERAGRSRFLARTVLRSRISGKTFKRDIAPCTSVTRPAQFSGLDVLAILTIDLDRGMYSLDRDGVMAGAQVVYGSDRSLYVASHRFSRALELSGRVPEGMRTEIHRFDISNPEKTTYAATGSVPGFILNNYALSEHEGKLRVATTEDPPWVAGSGPAGERQSSVTVLEQQGKRLTRIGSVSGLGKGERIYAVRFMGDKGYVVTFRQIDPLYTLDLSNPRAPRVLGELKIPGYSAYLHPVGDDRLLGIGRDGPEVQASLFDVSDMANPQRVAQLFLGQGATTVEHEPHAFLYWPPAKLAVFPLQTYAYPSGAFDGAVGVRVDEAALAEAGRVTHFSQARNQPATIERALVIDEKLYTISWLGIQSSNLTDLGGLSFTAF